MIEIKPEDMVDKVNVGDKLILHTKDYVYKGFVAHIKGSLFSICRDDGKPGSGFSGYWTTAPNSLTKLFIVNSKVSYNKLNNRRAIWF